MARGIGGSGERLRYLDNDQLITVLGCKYDTQCCGVRLTPRYHGIELIAVDLRHIEYCTLWQRIEPLIKLCLRRFMVAIRRYVTLAIATAIVNHLLRALDSVDAHRTVILHATGEALIVTAGMLGCCYSCVLQTVCDQKGIADLHSIKRVLLGTIDMLHVCMLAGLDNTSMAL